MTRAAPPTARLPRWTKCQSFGRPSSLEYWHIGETAIRLRSSSERMANGENSRGGMICGILSVRQVRDALGDRQNLNGRCAKPLTGTGRHSKLEKVGQAIGCPVV